MKTIRTTNHSTGNIPDTEVIKRILDGEKELFEILLRRYNQTLYRVIRSYIQSENDVEDVMQNAYIKAFQKLVQFRGDATFSTWLIRIGINEALQHIRKNKRNPGANGHDEDLTKILQLPETDKMNPEKHMIKHEIQLLVEKAIDRLPEKYRIIFMLHEVEGAKNSEIANCLNLSDSNVKVRLHRAKNLLKEEFYKLSSEAPVFEFGNSRCDRIVYNVMNNIQ